MKRFVTLMLTLAFMLTIFSYVSAQTAGDFRTKASGNWSSSAIWERYNGSTWGPVGTPPTGAETTTVLAVDSVYVNVPVSISGSLVQQGIIEPLDSLTITIADGGTLQYDRDAGGVPQCIWATGSTMLITGVTSTAPEDRDQDYYNLTFNTPGLLSNLNMNLNNNTIGGDIRVVNTNAARWYLTSAEGNGSSTVTIMGDIIVENGNFSSNGTSNAFTTFIVYHHGNIIVTGGNFSVSRGSQGSGTGSTRWYFYGDEFSMSNATTQNSNPTNAWFVFAKQGTQKLTLGEGNTLTALPFEVSEGTTLDMGSSVLAGSGIVMVDSAATLMTSLEGGVAEIFGATTGTVTLSDGSGYGFNGTAAQITSTMMPETVGDVIINNAAGVTLSQATMINGLLRLISGVFDNTINFTLGPNGGISYEGGSLVITSIESNALNIPESFYVNQNYPNPFNPSTKIHFGLPKAAHVSAKVFNLLGQEVADLYNGQLKAGEHELLFDASPLTSGIYFYRISAGNLVSIKRMMLIK